MIGRAVVLGLCVCAVMVALPATASAIPGGPATAGSQPQDESSAGGGDCAGGFPILEQACDAGEAVVGAVGGAADAVAGAPGAAASAIGGGVLDQVTKWMTDAAKWVTKKIQGFITETTTPELQAQWYRERFGAMVALGGGLSVLVAMIALGSAALRRDPDALGATFIGMFRAGIGTGIVLALVVLALGIADGISNWVATDASGEQASKFWGDVATAWDGEDNAGFGSAAIAFVFALLQVIAGIAVWLELLVRSAGIYVAVLFMPAALAASIWPALRAWQSRLVGLLFVLIAMKPVIVVVLSLAGSAAAAGGDADKDLGVLVAAVMILVLAAFTPWVLMMLVSMDSEGAWNARTSMGSMKGATAGLAGGAGRVGGGLGGAAAATAGSLGGRRGGGLGGGGGRGSGGGRGGSAGKSSGGRGGGAPGSSGGGGGGGAQGGGGSPSGGGDAGGGGRSGGAPAPSGTVAAAAGLVPPGGGKGGGGRKGGASPTGAPAAGAASSGGSAGSGGAKGGGTKGGAPPLGPAQPSQGTGARRSGPGGSASSRPSTPSSRPSGPSRPSGGQPPKNR